MRLSILCIVIMFFTHTADSAAYVVYHRLLSAPLDLRSRSMEGVGVALPGPSYALDINPALLVNQPEANVGTAGIIWRPRLRMDLRGAWGWPEYDRIDFGPSMVVYLQQRTELWRVPIYVGLAYTRYIEQYYLYGYSRSRMTQEAFSLGIAYRPDRHLAVGYSAHRLDERLDNFSFADFSALPASWAHDIGFYISGVLPQLTWVSSTGRQDDRGVHLGMALKNLGAEIGKGGYYTHHLPRSVTLGVSWPLARARNTYVLLAAQIRRPLAPEYHGSNETVEAVAQIVLDALTLNSRRDDQIGVGLEFGITQHFEVRAGIGTDASGQLERWSMGVGYTVRHFRFICARTMNEQDYEEEQAFQIEVSW